MGSDAQQLHVFFFPFMAHGHSIPMIDIARLFASMGVKSTIITTPLNALHFEETINRDKQSGLDIGIQILPFPSVKVGLPEECENFNCCESIEMSVKFFQALALLQEPFEQLLDSHHPNCIVTDAFLAWTADVANKRGIPRLCFHGTSSFSQCVVESIKRYAPHEKAASDDEIFVVPGLADQIEMTRSQLQNCGSIGFTELINMIRETEAKSFGVLVNSFYELEPAYTDYYRKELGRKVWNIGPVSLYNRNNMDKAHRGMKASAKEHHSLNWLDSKETNSVLYVSFGSVSGFGTAQIHEIAMGLEASNVSFLWVVNVNRIAGNTQILPRGFEERMQGKGLIITDWAPQVLILDHPAIGGFMTHCGWNSTLEGITAGLPLITWPLFAEQFNNEKLVTQVLKIGVEVGNVIWNEWVELENVTVTKEMVEKVVAQLMGNNVAADELRRRALTLGKMAKNAVESGGSSYADLMDVINELRVHSQTTIREMVKQGHNVQL